jgi:hypothetical protein
MKKNVTSAIMFIPVGGRERSREGMLQDAESVIKESREGETSGEYHSRR